MTKDELWAVYVRKNPKFKDQKGTFTFTAKGLYDFFERTYDNAHEEGLNLGIRAGLEYESEPEQTNNSKYNTNDFGEIFSSLFGRGKF